MPKGESFLVLFNPSAEGGQAAKKKDRLEALLKQNGIPYELAVTESEVHLRELAAKGARSGRTIVAAGGDSTFHIVVNELMKVRLRPPLGLVGIGSSNDIALEFGIETMDKACLALKKARVRKIDLGMIRWASAPPVYYLGQSNIGLGAAVNRYVARLAERKRPLAKRQTLAGILGILNAYRTRKIPVDLKISGSGRSLEGPFVLAVFSNIRFWATGKVLCPGAVPDDGRLDACLFRDCSFTRLARLNSLTNRGRHGRCREVETLQSASFEVVSGEPFLIQTDGEMLIDPLTASPLALSRVTFEAARAALDLIA